MKNWLYIFTILIIGITSVSACNKEEINSLSVDTSHIDFTKEGGSASFQITTDAEIWSIQNPNEDWIKLSKSTGTANTGFVTISVATKTTEPRAGKLIITAGNAKPVEVVVSQLPSDYLYELSTSIGEYEAKRSGETFTFNLSSDAPEWSLSSNVDWISLDKTSGTESFLRITAIVTENSSENTRTGKITLSAESAQEVSFNVSQSGELYPSYNISPIAEDMTGVESTATELAAKIKIGWNLGNSLEATGGETSWGNPVTNQALIDLVKANGFNAVRIPCAWNALYVENAETAKIKASWLARVKEVVDYCVSEDMYAIINIHWDGGWLENNCTPDKQEENNAKQKAFWEQIATYFRDYDEHLIFAGENEPNVENATEMAVLNSYSQTFIDAVRSTGGKNAYRNLIIQGPSTDIEKTNNLMILPTDAVPNRMMVEVHYYSPWNFCGMEKDEDWGKMFYYWGNGYHSTTDTDRNASYGEESEVRAHFQSMKSKFVDKGIPVLLGEYGAIRRTSLTGEALELHLNSRAYYLKYVTQQAKANGLIPVYWDNGATGNNGFALFNRSSKTVFDQQAINALMEGAAK